MNFKRATPFARIVRRSFHRNALVTPRFLSDPSLKIHARVHTFGIDRSRVLRALYVRIPSVRT